MPSCVSEDGCSAGNGGGGRGVTKLCVNFGFGDRGRGGGSGFAGGWKDFFSPSKTGSVSTDVSVMLMTYIHTLYN